MAPVRASTGASLHRFAVTISRQTGSGAHAVGEMLAKYLQGQSPKGSSPWRLFDRDLAEKVLEDHNLPRRYTRFMPEDRVSEVAETMDELFWAHPPSSSLVRQTAETILRLAQEGNVILIGRGANVVTSKLDHVLHVRLVASLENRVAQIQKVQAVGRDAALEFIRKEDLGRRRYLKKYFNEEVDNPLLYHLVLNTDLVPYDRTARMIGDAVLSGLHRKSRDRAGDVEQAIRIRTEEEGEKAV
jgi:cytidylate kinase